MSLAALLGGSDATLIELVVLEALASWVPVELFLVFSS